MAALHDESGVPRVSEQASEENSENSAAIHPVSVSDATQVTSTVTLKDVARLAKVSVASVSNYLNDYPHMRESMKEKIQRAIDELGYVANESARTLKSGRTGLITLSIPDLTQVYFAELAEEIIHAAREYHYGVLVESTGSSRSRELASVHAMAKHMTDGLILSPVKMDMHDNDALDNNIPLVMLGERIFNAPAPHVVIDNVNAAYAATEHLLRAGCRSIAVVGGTLDNAMTSSRSLRTQGYCQALRDYGIRVDSALIRTTGEWTSKNGALAVQQMYAQGCIPDAIFALNDLLALGVISQLREMRIAIPEEVRVVGFDNINESQYTIPSLTTVDPGRSVIAKLAVESIIHQLDSGTRAAQVTRAVPYTLVYRSSSPEVS